MPDSPSTAALQADLAAARAMGDSRAIGVRIVQLCWRLLDDGDVVQALPLAEEAVRRLAEWPASHPYCCALTNLARSREGVGQYDAAIAAYQEVLLIESFEGHRHSESAILSAIGLLEVSGDRLEAAGRTFERALSAPTSDPSDHLAALVSLAGVEAHRGRHQVAADMIMAVDPSAVPPGSRGPAGWTLTLAGHQARAEGSLAVAIERYQRALALYADEGDAHGRRLTTETLLATAYEHAGRLVEAESLFRGALTAIDDGVSMPMFPHQRRAVLQDLGEIRAKLGDLPGARSFLEEAVREARAGGDDSEIATATAGLRALTQAPSPRPRRRWWRW